MDRCLSSLTGLTGKKLFVTPALKVLGYFRVSLAGQRSASCERLLPGDVIQEKLERTILQAGAVAVCIEPRGLGRWETVEYHAVYERLISDSEPDEKGHGFRGGDRGLRVIPVLLPGATLKQIPLFLRQHMHLDLRKSSGMQRRETLQKLAAAVLERR